MASDPVERLLDGIDRPLSPRPEFAEALLDRLLVELEHRAATEHDLTEPRPEEDSLIDARSSVPANSRTVTSWSGVSVPEGSNWRPWRKRALSSLATAALVVVTLVASYVAFGPDRPSGQVEDQVFLAAPSEISATPATAAEPGAAFLWSAEGSPDQQFGSPGHPAIDPQGNVWFTDGAHHRFVIFSPDGTYLESWGTAGSAEGEFNLAPLGEGYGAVAFDDANNIYVADSGNARIQKFGPDRTFLTTWGSRGVEDGQFQSPVAVTVDGQGRVFVSDRITSTVQVLDLEGQWLATWARVGRDPGEVSGPGQLGVDSQGNLWVPEEGTSRVQKFSPDGELLLTLTAEDTDDGELQSPTGLAVDDQDRVFVSDRVVNRILVFSTDGMFLGTWGESGTEDGQLNGPYGLALDGRGNAYVTEDRETRLQAFRLLPPLGPG